MPDADPLCGSAPDPADARDSSDSPPDCPTNHLSAWRVTPTAGSVRRLVPAGSFGLARQDRAVWCAARVPRVILWLPWLPFRSAVRRPAGHKAWMSHPCRLNSMNAASTPYVGHPQGPGCGVEVTSGAESAAVGHAGTHEPAQRRNRFIEWRRILGPYSALTRYATHCDDKLPLRHIAQSKVAVRSSGSRPAR